MVSVLSKPLGPIMLKLTPLKKKPQGYFKRKWKYWLQNKIKKTKEQLDEAQTRYKKNYDAGLRKPQKFIREDDYVYLTVERKNPEDH